MKSCNLSTRCRPMKIRQSMIDIDQSKRCGKDMMMASLDVQIGGDHYKKMKIQPIEYTVANQLPFIEGCIIKYATRHRDKNGAADIRKIIHYCQLLLELEYGEEEESLQEG